METRSAPGSERSRWRWRWLVQGGVVLVAVLLLWASGQSAGLWLAPARPSTQEAPLAAPPAPQDRSPVNLSAFQDLPLATLPVDDADHAPPAPAPDALVKLYLPAIVVGPPLPAPERPPQPVAAQFTAPQSTAPQSVPLSLPDPRLDIPPSTARSRLDRSIRQSPPLPPEEAPAAVASSPAAAEDASAVGASLAAPGSDASSAVLASSAVSSSVPLSSVAPARWIWPVQGEISQFFSQRHRAIDIVSGQGAWVVAADGGKVVYAEWETSGFGYLVIVDHGDDYQTYYGHLYGFYVDVGQRVERGDLLGQLGNTGNSTGPHLHFEIRYRGLSRDPLDLLPAGRP